MISAPLLRLTKISKSFGAVLALKGVSFELNPGEIHSLLGEHGAGKSTLIKVITGAHKPDGGTLEIAGSQVSGLTPTKARELGIACICQQPELFPELSVAENIGLRLECGIAAIAVLNNGITRVAGVLKAGVGGELASLLTDALLLIALAAPILTRFITRGRATQTLEFSSQ